MALGTIGGEAVGQVIDRGARVAVVLPMAADALGRCALVTHLVAVGAVEGGMDPGSLPPGMAHASERERDLITVAGLAPDRLQLRKVARLGDLLGRSSMAPGTFAWSTGV